MLSRKASSLRLADELTGPPKGACYPIPAGGLFSTGADLGRLYQMMLHRGQLDGRRMLSESAVKTMTDVQTGSTDADTLGGQQTPFHGRPLRGGVTAQPPVGRNHAMAGNDERHSVRGHDSADGGELRQDVRCAPPTRRTSPSAQRGCGDSVASRAWCRKRGHAGNVDFHVQEVVAMVTAGVRLRRTIRALINASISREGEGIRCVARRKDRMAALSERCPNVNANNR